jgi:aerobic carbon-monoxide dehydrogenase medium subunit
MQENKAMILTPFTYIAPESLAEAIQVLAENKDACLLAGGQSLLTEMRLRHVTPSLLVDLHKIEALHGIEYRRNGTLHIGALTTFLEIAENEDIQENYPILIEAVKSTSDAQIRNRRTIGGTLAFNTLGADFPAITLALGATLTLSGLQGTRILSAAEFNAASAQSGFLKDEIIQAVTFPSIAGGNGSAYSKFKNRASDYALGGVATSVILTSDDTLHECRVAVTGATRYATRLIKVEAILNGKQATIDTIEAASQEAGELDCISDLAASAVYRASLVQTLTERSLTRAIARARESLR